MTELPDDIAELFAAERGAPGPSEDARHRVHGRIAVTVGITVAATATASSTAAASTGAVATGIAGKIVALVLVVGAIGGGVALAIHGGRDSRASTSPAPIAERAAPAATAPLPTVTPIEVPPASPPELPRVVVPPPSAPVVAPRSARPAAVKPPPPSEGAVLARAWTALDSGKPEAGLALVEEDEHVHPTGSLAEERDALRIEALLRLDRGDEARRRAAAFAVRYPSSVHGDIVDRAMTKSPGSGQ